LPLARGRRLDVRCSAGALVLDIAEERAGVRPDHTPCWGGRLRRRVGELSLRVRGAAERLLGSGLSVETRRAGE
jgi:hypothetical protein